MKKPIVVNFLGGSGLGKSTMSASLFAHLKKQGVDCELITEYAKDKCWEESAKVLDNQPYVFGKQFHRLQRVADKVECCVTDSPLILSILYNKEFPSLNPLVIECFNKFRNINILLKRTVGYNENGRLQTYEEASEMDRKLIGILEDNDVPYWTFDPMSQEEEMFDVVSKLIRLHRD